MEKTISNSIFFKELINSFQWKRIPGVSGQRDFLSLTIILVVLITLTIVLIGSRSGIMNQLSDILMGKLPGHGFPVWLTADIGNIKNKEIKKISDVNIEGLEIFPYIEVESKDVSLPGYDDQNPLKSVWEENYELIAWAVYNDDPLWEQSSSKPFETNESIQMHSNFPLEVMLDPKQFEKCFDCEKYIKALLGKIPTPFWNDIPRIRNENDNLYCLQNNQIWLRVRTGWWNEYVKFKIQWPQKNIHAMEKISYLFPLTTYQALKLSQFDKKQYFMEGKGDQVTRAIRISISGTDLLKQESIQSFQNCVCAEYSDSIIEPDDDYISFHFKNLPLQENWLKTCAISHNLNIAGENDLDPTPPYITIDEAILSTPLSYDPKGFIVVDEKSNSIQSVNKKRDVLHIIGGYHYSNILAYIPEGLKLKNTINKLTSLTKESIDGKKLVKIFDLHATYQDALARFSFLDEALSTLVWPFTIILALLVAIILIVKLAIVIKHRRYHYGILLTKGFKGFNLYRMICFQIILCFIMASFCATILFFIIKTFLNTMINKIALHYQDYLVTQSIDLLPMSFVSFLFSYTGLIVLGLIVSILIIAQSMRWKIEPDPSLLLHE